MESSRDPVLIVVGGGAAGVFGAVRAKTVCPQLKVLVLEKGKLLSKVSLHPLISTPMLLEVFKPRECIACIREGVVIFAGGYLVIVQGEVHG